MLKIRTSCEGGHHDAAKGGEEDVSDVVDEAARAADEGLGARCLALSAPALRCLTHVGHTVPRVKPYHATCPCRVYATCQTKPTQNDATHNAIGVGGDRV